MENQNEHPLFPELTEEGKREAQNLMNRFEQMLKVKAVEIIEKITTEFYCDILNDIESDHWQNFRTKILSGLCHYSNSKKNASYDFERIRRAIYNEHREEINKDLNQDLLKENVELKKTIEYLQRNRL
jgi:hypothetical protein